VSDTEFLSELDTVLEMDKHGKMALPDPAVAASVDDSDKEPVEEAVDVQAVGSIPRSAAEPPSEAALDMAVQVSSAPVAEAIKHAWNDSSTRWLGAMFLLAIFAVSMGVLSLWRMSDIEDRLNRIEPVSSVIPAPALDTKKAENAQRIDNLERRLGRSMERMQADVEALGTSLAKELARRNERLDGDLSALNATLSSLQEQLRVAQALMAEADKLAELTSNTPIATEPASAQSAPDPGPPTTEGIVTSAPAVSIESKKPSSWSVNLFAADRQEKTDKELARFRAQDVPAEMFSVINKDKVWYRIAVRGFDSFEKASAYAETLRSKPGMSGAWVGRD
jgi:hypothetical protein